MADKPKLITSPRLEVAGFVAIQSPGTKYDTDGSSDEDYEFQIAVAGEEDDPKFRAFIEQLEGYRDEFADEQKKEDPKKKRWKTLEIGSEEEDDDGEPTGRRVLKLKQNYVVKGKKGTFKKKVGLFDAKGNPITKTVRIGNGSVVKVSFAPNPYPNNKDKEFGFSFNRLSGVQLIKLVERPAGGASADDMGFEAEDDEDAFDATEFDGGDEQSDAPGVDETEEEDDGSEVKDF